MLIDFFTEHWMYSFICAVASIYVGRVAVFLDVKYHFRNLIIIGFLATVFVLTGGMAVEILEIHFEVAVIPALFSTLMFLIGTVFYKKDTLPTKKSHSVRNDHRHI